MPRALKDSFNTTNTSHIIAISGFNIAIIAIYLGVVARRLFAFKPRLADWFVILALIGYTLLVGASASVVRAAIMGVLGVIAIHYGREAFALNSLALAALLMTLLNPFATWDLGFQLSFFATMGLLLYSEPLYQALDRALKRVAGKDRAKRLLAVLSDSLVVSVAAWITTTPILVATFHRISLIGLVTNLLVLPAQPPIMVLGGLATITQLCAGLLTPVPFAPLLVSGLAHVLAWGVNVFLQYTIIIVQWTAQFPWAATDTPRIDWAIVALVYVLIFLTNRVTPRRLASMVLANPTWAVGALAFAIVLLWTSALAAPDARTHVQFIATGGGDATFIRTSKDTRILINGSSEPSALLAHLGNQMPFWDRRLDVVIVAHLDESNLASLNSVLERYNVGQVIEPHTTETAGASYIKWRELLVKGKVNSTSAVSGTRLIADEISLDVLYPNADNPGGRAALRLSAGGHTVLLAPSLRAADLAALNEPGADLAAEFAVLPGEFDQELLDRVAPKTAIMFVGRSSREKPSAETQKLMKRIQVLRTDERGTIEVIVDGDELRAKSER